MTEQYDVIILGSGVSGFAAAIYSARFNLRTLVIGKESGGALNNATDVENYPGFIKIGGMELADKIKEHAMSYDIKLEEIEVVSLGKSGNGFIVMTKDDKEYKTKTLIIATGTQHRKLMIPGEEEFKGNGVHVCALCDGRIYKDKDVAVIGGSDSAAKEALILAEYCKRVFIIYRKEEIRAEPITKKRVAEKPNIEIINNTNIKEIKGDKVVRSVVLGREYKGSKDFDIDAVFVNIGSVPLTFLTEKIGVKLNDKKEIITDKESKTNVPGVFAAGDCTEFLWKQAITGVAQGCVAAYSAYKFLQK